MNIYEDYNSYIVDMKNLIKMLENSKSPVYILIEDALNVTKYIYKEHEKGSKLDDVLEEIFEAGYGYLSNVLNDLNIMYEEYFDSNIDIFNYYAPLIIYSIYLEDYRCHLEAEELLTEEREEFIKNIESQVDSLLANKVPYNMEKIDEWEEEILTIAPAKDKFEPVYIIYSMIVEELHLI